MVNLLPGEEKWARHFQGLLQSVEVNKKGRCTHFADPRQQQIARELLDDYASLKCFFWGGYPEAERARICVFSTPPPLHFESEVVACLAVEGSFPEGILSHRDFLGALLGLGIRREAVGDIVYPGKERAYVFIMPEQAPYVRQSLQSVGRYAIRVSEIKAGLLDEELKTRRVREIKGTVPSMRLDAVAGLGFGLSRSKIMPLIKGSQVKVNYQIVRQPSRMVKVGDVISLTGKGRVEISSTGGQTRKGRVHVMISRIF